MLYPDIKNSKFECVYFQDYTSESDLEYHLYRSKNYEFVILKDDTEPAAKIFEPSDYLKDKKLIDFLLEEFKNGEDLCVFIPFKEIKKFTGYSKRQVLDVMHDLATKNDYFRFVYEEYEDEELLLYGDFIKYFALNFKATTK